jgi:hypothetical protein
MVDIDVRHPCDLGDVEAPERVRVPHTSSWYRLSAVSSAPAHSQRGSPSYPMITSLLIRPSSLLLCS